VFEAPANPEAADDDVTKRLSYIGGISASQDILTEATKMETEKK
jgi:hypothetical protein